MKYRGHRQIGRPWSGTLIHVSVACWLLAGTAFAGPQTVDYVYDDADRLVTVTYGTSSAIHYQYDEAGNRTRKIVVGPGNPTADHNTNGLADLWELVYFNHLDSAPNADPDNDTLDNSTECSAGTNPTEADTDGDGADDAAELDAGSDPLDPDDVPGYPVMWLKLDETNGTTAVDSTTNDHDGVVSQAVTVGEPGVSGTSFRFSETSQVEVTDFDHGPDMTLAFWFRKSDNGGTNTECLFSHGAFNSGTGLAVVIIGTNASNGAGELRTMVNGQSISIAGAGTELSDDAWHHYALTVDDDGGQAATNKRCVVFVDGVVQTVSVGVPSGGMDSDDPLRLGGYPSDMIHQFWGWLDDMRLYGTPLESSKVYALARPGEGSAKHGFSVVSAHGGCYPPVGLHTNRHGTSAQCVVTNPVITALTTQYVCMGWIGTGSIPPEGGTTNSGWFAQTNTTTVSWRWQTNYWFETELSPGGTINMSNGWFAADTQMVVTATPGLNRTFLAWTGDTNGCLVAGNDISVSMDRPRRIGATFEVHWCTLQVTSAHGNPIPGVGIHTNNWGVSVTCRVSSVETVGTTQYVCTGWTGSGSAPPEGGTTNTSYALTNNSSITWNWRTQYRLDVEVTGSGNVDRADQWVDSGVYVVVTATAEEHHRFTGWSGQTNGCIVVENVIVAPMTQARNISATFVIHTHSFEVSSAHGSPSPAAGMYVRNYGTVFSNTVALLDTHGATQHVCTGWTGTGSVPPEGGTTNVSFILTNDSSIAWQWQTRYWLDTDTAGNGGLSATDQWVMSGSNVAITATADPDHHFTGWSGGTSGCVIAGATITVPMSRARRISAGFVVDAYTLQVVSAHGTTDPAVGTYTNNHGAVLNSTVNSPETQGAMRYLCTGWTGTGSVPPEGGTTSVVFSLTNDSSITWEWQTQYWLDIESGANGGVDVADQWVDMGSNVVVIANADAHHHLTGWTGDTNGCAIAGPQITVPLDDARQITANFGIDRHTLNVTSPHGTASPVAGLYTNDWGTSVTCRVSGVEMYGWTQYVCVGWTGTGSAPPEGGTTNVTFSLTNDSVIAWNWQTQYWGEWQVAGGQGDVDQNGGWHAAGTNVTVTATASNHWHFDGWSGHTNGCAINGAEIVVPMDGARQISATFAIDQHTLVVSSAQGVVSPSVGTNTYQYNTGLACVVSNSPVLDGTTQYVCTGWTGSGSVPPEGGTTNVAFNLTNDSSIAWNWETRYLLAIGPCENGTVAPTSGWHVAGTNVPLTATADDHWGFGAWTGDTNGCVVNSNFITVAMSGPRAIAATFVTDENTLQVVSAHGTPSPAAGIHANTYGAVFTNRVGRYDTAGGIRHVCTGWTGTGSAPPEGGTTNVVLTLTNDTVLTWNWTTQYWLNVESGANGGVDTAAQWVGVGSNVTITATANTHYSFSGWSGATNGCVIVGNQITVPMTAARQVSAAFGSDEHTVEIVSAHGTPDPAAGVHTNDYGTSVECRVPGVETIGGTQYVCVGWTGTGSAPPEGGTTNVGFTLTNDSSVAWNWATQYWLNTAADSHGTVDVPDRWVGAGSNVVVTATANAHWQFGFWSGDTNGCGISSNSITVLMNRPRWIAAVFGTDENTLQIVSAHGNPLRPVGLHAASQGTVLTNNVNPCQTSGSTQYVCTGWSLTGVANTNGLASGTGTNVILALTNNAVLAWNWKTRYWLDTDASAHGSVNIDDGWVDASGYVVVQATASNNYAFASWSGDTNMCDLLGATIVVPMDRPRLIRAEFAIERHILQVVSVRDVCEPGVGTYTNDYGVVLTNCTAGIDMDGMTQYVCVGWTGTGSVPPEGGTTNVSFTLTNDSSITWNWQTQYWLDTEVAGNGAVDKADQWVSAGTNLTVSATPASNHYFSGWTGDTNGCVLNGNQLSVAMNQPRQITATFVPGIAVELIAGAHGAVAPTGVVAVAPGSDLGVLFTPDPHYHVERVRVARQVFYDGFETHPVGSQPAGWATGWTSYGTRSVVASPVSRGAKSVNIRGSAGSCTGIYKTDSARAGNQVVCFDVYLPADYGSVPNPALIGYVGQSVYFIVTNGTHYCLGGTGLGGFALDTWYTLRMEIDWDNSTVTYCHGTRTSDTIWFNKRATSGPTIDLSLYGQHHSGSGYFDEMRIMEVSAVGPTNAYTVTDVTNHCMVLVDFVRDQHTLTVATAQGAAVPGVGVNTYDYDTVVTCRVSDVVVTDGGTQHVCLGWTGTGSVPPEGGTTNVAITLTNDSSIAWHWQTQHWLDVEASAGGGVNITDQWVDAGDVVVITATPDPNHGFVSWSGDTNGCTIIGSTMIVTMDKARQITAAFMKDRHTLTISSAHGTSAPSVGIYTNDWGTSATCNVSSVETVGTTQYVSTGWVGSGSVAPEGGTTNVVFALTNDSSITWEWQTQYGLDVEAGSGGSLNTGDRWVAADDVVVVVASPADHYGFQSWSGDTNGCTIIGSTMIVTMDKARRIEASFQLDRHTLTVGSEHGTTLPAPGAYTYDYGMVLSNVCASLDALGGTQYLCVGWTGTGSTPPEGGTTNVAFMLTNDSSVAWQWQTQYWLNAISGPNGSVMSSNGWYAAGTTGVVATAVSSNGYHFVNWTGDLASANTVLTLTVDKAYSLTANFAINMYDIVATVGSNGNIAPSGVVEVAHECDTNFVITSAANYHVADVLVNGASIGATNAVTFANVTSNQTIHATFAIDRHTLTLTSAYGITAPTQGAYTNDYGAVLTNSVLSPDTHGATQYVCVGWTGSGSAPPEGGTTNVSFTLTNDSSIAWQWKTQYWLNAVAGEHGSVVASNGWYDAGTTGLGAMATPSEGYHFVNWTGTLVSTANPLIIALDQAHSIAATFAINMYDITASPGPNGSISPSGVMQVGHGSNITFNVSADPHYYVADVLTNGSSIGPTNAFTFINVTTNHAISATFDIDRYALTVITPHGVAVPSGLTTNSWDAQVSCSITNSPVLSGTTQYVCVGWTGTGSVPPEGGTTNVTFALTNDSSIVWQWKTQYWLNATSGPNGYVSASNGWYDAEVTGVTVNATASNSYYFTGWTGDIVTNTNPLILTMGSAYSITGRFESIPAPTNTVLSAPSGTITTDQPEFVWAGVDHATAYLLSISRDNVPYATNWVVVTNYVPTNNLPFGSYEWRVKTGNAVGEGLWSDSMVFSYGDTVTLSPTGTVAGTRMPVLSWTAVAGATSYSLWINRNGVTYETPWVDGTNAWTPSGQLLGGHYKWWVSAWNSGGYGPWSAAGDFTIPANVPDKATLRTPAGPIITNRPEFVWDAVDDASWYRLRIDRNNTVYTNKWLNDRTNYTFDAPLPFGRYTWWVRTWNADGLGAWSDPSNFVYGLATPLSPAGYVGDTREPEFTWTAVPDAAWYHVWLSKGNQPYLSQWVQGSNSWSFGTEFQGDDYRWWICTWNPDSMGPWSEPAAFVISNVVPASIILISPTGTVFVTTVTYTWQADAAATWYQLWVGSGGNEFHSQWYKTGTVTGQVSRSVTGHSTNTTYNWWVRGWGPDGMGKWSGGTFAVE